MYKILYDGGDSDWLEEKLVAVIALKPKKHVQAEKTKPLKKPSSPKSVIPDQNNADAHPRVKHSDVKRHAQDHEYLKNPNVKPKVKLQSGWIWHLSKGKGRWYCFEASTGKKVWYPEEIMGDVELEDLF